MFREEEQLIRARADDAALPFGNDVRRRSSGAGNGILPLAPALAQRGEFFAQTRGVENARKSLPGYRCAGKPLQRHVQRRAISPNSATSGSETPSSHLEIGLQMYCLSPSKAATG